MAEAEAEARPSEAGAPPGLADLPGPALGRVLAGMGARDLCAAEAACRALRRAGRGPEAERRWRDLFRRRWGASDRGTCALVRQAGAPGAKALYRARELGGRALLGGYVGVPLYGHQDCVRSVSCLASAGLLASGSADSTVRLWDEEGSALGAVRIPRSTVRAVALAEGVLAAGSWEGIRVWRGAPTGSAAEMAASFGLKGGGTVLRKNHSGPVSALEFDAGGRCLISGSWDRTVQLWSRDTFEHVRTLRHRDWIWDVAPRGGLVHVAAGPDLVCHDLETGRTVAELRGAHGGAPIYAVEGEHSGRLLYSGGETGSVRVHDLRQKAAPAAGPDDVRLVAGPGLGRVLVEKQNAQVNDLALDGGFLGVASSDGTATVLDLERHAAAAGGGRRRCMKALHAAQPMMSLSICGTKVVAGGLRAELKIYDFSRAFAASLDRLERAARPPPSRVPRGLGALSLEDRGGSWMAGGSPVRVPDELAAPT